MRFLGLSLTREKGAVAPMTSANSPGLAAGVGWNSIWGTVRESFAGAWQRNIEVESRQNLLGFSPVYAAVSLIAGDISKLRLKLTERSRDGIWEEITDGASAFLPVIRRPNRYQTRAQFVSTWIVSKLLNGNTYVLKVRDARQVVVSLFVLEPRLVTPIVTDDGAVYYRLKKDALSEVTEDDLVVPASEIIHDRAICPWHPLVGVSPLVGCGISATQGLRIQNNSAQFFENMSRPSGVLTAPATIKDETAARLKDAWETNYSGANLGKVAVLGDGLRYEPMTIPAQQSQLTEQLKLTMEAVASCFHIPLHMLQSGTAPPLASIGAINQLYYSQALQTLINDLEDCYADGLGLPWDRAVEFDLDDLFRLDPLSRAETSAKAIGAGYMKPNEGRLRENLPPVDGGDTPYLQQQNYALSALAERDRNSPLLAAPAPQLPATPPAPPPEGAAPPSSAEDADERGIGQRIADRLDAIERQSIGELQALREAMAQEKQAEADAEALMRALVERFQSADADLS